VNRDGRKWIFASAWVVVVDKHLAHRTMNDFDATEIWFVRHAESEANVQRIYANNGCSFPLTANGLQNAQTLARLLSFVPIRAIYTSPLLRATQTAEQICKLKKIEMQVAPELSEYSMGIYEGTSTLPGTLGAICDTESKKRWFEHNDFDAAGTLAPKVKRIGVPSARYHFKEQWMAAAGLGFCSCQGRAR
jgi:hypothetical protein